MPTVEQMRKRLFGPESDRDRVNYLRKRIKKLEAELRCARETLDYYEKRKADNHVSDPQAVSV